MDFTICRSGCGQHCRIHTESSWRCDGPVWLCHWSVEERHRSRNPGHSG